MSLFSRLVCLVVGHSWVKLSDTGVYKSDFWYRREASFSCLLCDKTRELERFAMMPGAGAMTYGFDGDES